jgi:hypothetical protein
VSDGERVKESYWFVGVKFVVRIVPANVPAEVNFCQAIVYVRQLIPPPSVSQDPIHPVSVLPSVAEPEIVGGETL